MTDYERGQLDMRDEIAELIRATAEHHADNPAFAEAIRHLGDVIGRFEPKQDPQEVAAAVLHLERLRRQELGADPIGSDPARA